MKYMCILCKVIPYEFICQKDILNRYIFWKHTSFCKWNENFSMKLYISGHRLRSQTPVPHWFKLLKPIY